MPINPLSLTCLVVVSYHEVVDCRWLLLMSHICVSFFLFFFLHKDGFVFRIKIMHYREMVLLQQCAATKDGKAKDDKAARELEREIIHLPILTSTLHG